MCTRIVAQRCRATTATFGSRRRQGEEYVRKLNPILFLEDETENRSHVAAKINLSQMLRSVVKRHLFRVQSMEITTMRDKTRPMTILCALLLLSIFHGRATASTQCTPDPVYGGQDCVSQVQFGQFAQTAYQTQQLTEWCWAASIA